MKVLFPFPCIEEGKGKSIFISSTGILPGPQRLA
jgi:hypothetical protein